MEYSPLSAANCASLGAAPLQINGFQILADADVLQQARWLAWTDVINAGAWILVVILLEVEGAGDYLPSYSGNLDIMTAAAKATGELIAERIAA